MRPAGCARCGEPATTVVVELSALTAYVDLCERHLAELLVGARHIQGAGDKGFPNTAFPVAEKGRSG